LENWILAESLPYLNQKAKPNLRRLESDEEYLKNKGARNWSQKSQDRKLWKTILEEAKVYQECQNARRQRTKYFTTHKKIDVCRENIHRFLKLKIKWNTKSR
jgi:hypothetical protein